MAAAAAAVNRPGRMPENGGPERCGSGRKARDRERCMRTAADGWRGGTGSSSIGAHAKQGGRRQGSVQMTWSVRNFVSPRGPYTMVSGTVLRLRTHTHTPAYIRTHPYTPAHTRTHLWYYIILHACIIPLNKLAGSINEQTICVRDHDSSVRRISTAGAYIVCAHRFICILCAQYVLLHTSIRSTQRCSYRYLLICITISLTFFMRSVFYDDPSDMLEENQWTTVAMCTYTRYDHNIIWLMWYRCYLFVYSMNYVWESVLNHTNLMYTFKHGIHNIKKSQIVQTT